jgi:hypothetical protein
MFWPSWIVFISRSLLPPSYIEGKVNDYVFHGDYALNDHLLVLFQYLQIGKDVENQSGYKMNNENIKDPKVEERLKQIWNNANSRHLFSQRKQICK